MEGKEEKKPNAVEGKQVNERFRIKIDKNQDVLNTGRIEIEIFLLPPPFHPNCRCL